MSQNQHLSSLLTNLTDRLADTLHGTLGGLHFDFEAGGHVHNVTFGDESADTLGGTDGAEFTWGLEGDDRIGGGGMDDVLHGGAGADVVSGNMGDDEVEGGEGNDTLYGGPGADTLRGGPGNDHLDEGEGHSTVDGGMGDDTLVGGGGPDAFMIGRMSGHDVIKDFTAGPGMFDHLAVMDGLQWTDLAFADTADGGSRSVGTGVQSCWKASSRRTWRRTTSCSATRPTCLPACGCLTAQPTRHRRPALRAPRYPVSHRPVPSSTFWPTTSSITAP